MYSSLSIIGLLPLLLPLFLIGFLVYFLIKVIQFMKSKTEHNVLFLEKLDALLTVQKENRHNNSQH